MNATRDEVVFEARMWRGVPWRHQGRSRSGIDCAGLLALVGHNLNLTEYDKSNYTRRPDGTFLKFFKEAGCTPIKLKDATDGDMLIFAESGVPCHCGIRSTHHGQPGVIHAHAMRRQVIEETLVQASSVVGRPTHAFRLPGVEE